MCPRWRRVCAGVEVADAFVVAVGEYKLGAATGPEERHRPLLGRMVLAARHPAAIPFVWRMSHDPFKVFNHRLDLYRNWSPP